MACCTVKRITPKVTLLEQKERGFFLHIGSLIVVTCGYLVFLIVLLLCALVSAHAGERLRVATVQLKDEIAGRLRLAMLAPFFHTNNLRYLVASALFHLSPAFSGLVFKGFNVFALLLLLICLAVGLGLVFRLF